MSDEDDFEVPALVRGARIDPDAVLAYLSANPYARTIDIANACGYDPWDVSLLVNTASFKVRADELLPKTVGGLPTDSDRSHALWAETTEILLEKARGMTIRELLDTARLAQTALGMGSAGKSGPSVEINVNTDPRRLTDDELERIVIGQAREVK